MFTLRFVHFSRQHQLLLRHPNIILIFYCTTKSKSILDGSVFDLVTMWITGELSQKRGKVKRASKCSILSFPKLTLLLTRTVHSGSSTLKHYSETRSHLKVSIGFADIKVRLESNYFCCCCRIAAIKINLRACQQQQQPLNCPFIELLRRLIGCNVSITWLVKHCHTVLTFTFYIGKFE